MRTIVLAWVAAGAMGLLALPAPVQATEPAAECDRLAASPNDKNVAPGKGVGFFDIDAAPAVAACEASVAASPDDVRQLYQLARAYDAAEQYDKAMATYSAAADKGYALATSSVGALYDLGLGVEADPVKAAGLYQEAVDAGVVVAMENLGKMYEEGRGVAQDYGRAKALYQQAANAGSTYASGALGWMSESGFGGPQDDVAARKLYQIAADGGEAFAQHNLGVMYEDGRGGLSQDNAEALRYFNLAAAQKWPPAYLSLSYAYSEGRGVPKDIARAEELLRRGIQEGDERTKGDAQNDLAWLLATENTRLDEAEKLSREAVAADPENANRLDTLAWVLHQSGRDAEALPLAEKAVALDAEATSFAEHLAAIKAKLKT